MTTKAWPALLVAIAATLAGCTAQDDGGAPSPVTLREGFEGGSLEGWDVGEDLPTSPGTSDQQAMEADARVAGERASNGTRALRLSLGGPQVAGTIWIVRAVDVAPGVAYDLRLGVDAWSPNERSDRPADLVMYVGDVAPEREASFSSGAPIAGSAVAARAPLDQQDGWKRYELGGLLPASDDGQVWLAVGLSAAWETEMAYWLDEVALTLTPHPAAGA